MPVMVERLDQTETQSHSPFRNPIREGMFVRVKNSPGAITAIITIIKGLFDECKDMEIY